jgi:hypothetical protein
MLCTDGLTEPCKRGEGDAGLRKRLNGDRIQKSYYKPKTHLPNTFQDLLAIPDFDLTSQGNKRCSSLTKSELRFMHIGTENERVLWSTQALMLQKYQTANHNLPGRSVMSSWSG